ncbi:YkgJ family cysteine cluster protein [Haloarcula sp. CGMCC 1.6347]|uniref:YkgJ family cysteine cluster protein n=1 Tax=Haloarcula sp. CGMCC 1.6347 TaxID=3111455 RepID=UPI00300F172B
MDSLETELQRARALDESELADAIEAIGFECTRCGACCKAESACGEGGASDDENGGTVVSDGNAESAETDAEPHTATVFPDEIRRLQAAGEYDFRDVARPMPYGLADGPDGPEGETFEWALQTDDCGDCTFYAEDDEGTGACTVHGDRPLICRTYPFSIRDVDEHQHSEGGGLGTTEPMGGVVEQEGMVRAHECEGLGRDISREDAEDLAAALKERAVRELEEAIGVRDNYEPTDVDGVVVHDSEGQKRPDGTILESRE